MISRETCQATVDKMYADHDGMVPYVIHMQQVMCDREHKELFDLLLQVIGTSLPFDDDTPEQEQMDLLNERTFALTCGLIAYSCTFAAHEANELNEQFA